MADSAYLPDWPRIARAPDPALEARVEAILHRMTLEEKIGQMIQPELFQVTPAEAAEYRFGSILNGAGLFPDGNKHTDAAGWTRTVDAFWCAVDRAFADRPFRIPLLWATDAVHGHNNVFGATIFPHNVGLGCTNDPALIRRIGAATAREVAATGMDWTFAPNVAAPRDTRWGRFFEGYSEDPAAVARFGRAMVDGLQDPTATGRAGGPDAVLACPKHWIADGGTRLGVDRGDCFADEDTLRNVHAAGYLAAIDAGASAIMVSFSGWRDPANHDHSPHLPGGYNGKLAGSRRLLTEVLKDRIGFDGLLLTDWDAHAEVSRCSFTDAAYAINAGIDVLMVSPRPAWKGLFATIRTQVLDGLIPLARVDDAVARMLRAKLRAGLWDKPRPVERIAVRRPDGLGSTVHRDLAREAVRRSMVMLKNNAALPVARDARILVTGSAAADITKQTGGWSLSWQGTDNGVADFPGGMTVGQAVRAVVGADRCVVDPDLSFADPAQFDAVIVAFGEDAYAEMRGTIRPWRSGAYETLKESYAADLALLRRLRAGTARPGAPAILSLFFTGRPLYVTEAINLSDAFVVAWLPGPYADAITDLLFAAGDGRRPHDFEGRLAFSWPAGARDFELNHLPAHLAGSPAAAAFPAPYRPLFPFGYGLTYADPHRLGPLPLEKPVVASPVVPATKGAILLDGGREQGLSWHIYGHNAWSGHRVDFADDVDLLILRLERLNGCDQTGGLRLRFKGYDALFFARHADGEPRDMRPHAAADARFRFRVKVTQAPTAPMFLCLHDDYPGQPGHDIAPLLRQAGHDWHELEVPIRALAATGMELDRVDTPFMLYTAGVADLSIDGIRLLV